MQHNPERRQILQYGLMGMGAFIGFQVFSASINVKTLPNFNVLLPPDKNGVRLPEGFISRVVARSGQDLFGYTWHAAPDGGTTFLANDGGWVYVSNSELNLRAGGVGALRFKKNGEVIDAYSILGHTTNNCAGGPTPWQTWFSCEEVNKGYVWECDPFGQHPSKKRKALGRFKHEAVTVDSITRQLYLTEDEPDGCLYRYTPSTVDQSSAPDLENGVLEVAEVIHQKTGAKLRWHKIPDPSAAVVPTRKQVIKSTRFNGGEGIWCHQAVIYFATKGDNRVWAYDTQKNLLTVLYDSISYIQPVLTGVDNITASASGKILVAEDGGDMQIVVVSKQKVYPLLQVVDHKNSEITGPAFSPDGSRLYFSSQRGKTGRSSDGVTYEITGPFNTI